MEPSDAETCLHVSISEANTSGPFRGMTSPYWDYRYALVPNAGLGHVQASLAATLNLRICFSLGAEAVLGAVEEALDVRLVLHNDEHGDNHGEDHLAKVDAFEVVFRADIAKDGKCAEKSAPEDATNGDVFRGDREDNPEGKCAKNRQGQNREEHAEGRKHALTTAEACKAGEAVAENHEETSNKRDPCAVIGAASGDLCFAHSLGDKRSKKALQKGHEHDRESRLPAEHAECIREARILGAVVTNIKVLTFREFCYPYGAGDRPQQVRYWKTQ